MSSAQSPRAVTTATFAQDVLQRSQEVPVLVDFWASWCQPCQMLNPILESIATDYAGRVDVVKVNADEEQQLAAQLQVRSLPTVLLVYQGRIADGFVGVKPEEEIREMLARHLPPEPEAPPAESAEDRLQRLEAEHAQNPYDPEISLQLGEALAEQGDVERAETLLQELPVVSQVAESAERIRAHVHFHRAAVDAPSRSALQTVVENEPDNLPARHQLAARYVLEGEYEPAAEQLLEIVRRNRGFEEDLGRRALLWVFALLGAKDERTQRYRRRLAALVL